jgi:AcrR family transcriptional regulator
MDTVARTARGEARRRQILDGALSAIREQALADVQLASIAAHAGLKPSHVLYYFPSREDVLIATAAHAERRLADGRSERLRQIPAPEERLRAYITAYLPKDRNDPVWKLWMEAWLRFTSRDGFAEIGSDANLGWRGDLIETAVHAVGPHALMDDELTALARRFNFLLDGIALHVLAGHIEADDAVELALAAARSELRLGADGDVVDGD